MAASSRKERGKLMYRHLMQSHIDRYLQFAYSDTLQGLFCKVCVLSRLQFACNKTYAVLGKLVTKQLSRYDRLIGYTGELQCYLKTEHHKLAEERGNTFLEQQSKRTNI